MQQSNLLTQFYQAYAAWLDDGALDNVVFSRAHGLCTNLMRWCTVTDQEIRILRDLHRELGDQFFQARMSELVPFNKDIVHYHIEQGDGGLRQAACHLNRKRIEWVMQHAK